MESFFFNITDSRYKISEVFKEGDEHITRIDISNGVVFLDVALKSTKVEKFHINNLDRMVMISVVKQGALNIYDEKKEKKYICKNSELSIFASSRQDMKLIFEENSEVFILFIADFFLKRYLSLRSGEPIDFLYNLIQDEISLEHINTQATDALSLYLVDKIINSKTSSSMNSIRCEHSVIEFLIHRLSLCDVAIKDVSKEELAISKRAKDVLLKSFSSPPTIHNLAHLCATNESKLKKVFKKVFKMTIYNYIQKLRLKEANILLKERSLSVGEISKKVGYKHQGHFSKLFFSTYGVYPKNLLKS
jgi:AraC-like DNA-binding protein